MKEGTQHGPNGTEAPPPRVLLVEDDAVSAAFLMEAIAATPAQVALASSIGEALRLADRDRFALCLIDAHLPDGHGSELLAALRARGEHAPAIAHTAETAKAVLDRLIDAGFEEVLIKPLSVAVLQGAVRRFAYAQASASKVARIAGPDRAEPVLQQAPQLAQPSGSKYPLWDDAAALRALNGNSAHVEAMRRLFGAELPEQSRRIRAAIREHATDALRAELHKLIAGAGFVGAARLAEHARALQARLSAAGPEPAGIEIAEVSDACAQLEGTLTDTLDSV